MKRRLAARAQAQLAYLTDETVYLEVGFGLTMREMWAAKLLEMGRAAVEADFVPRRRVFVVLEG